MVGAAELVGLGLGLLGSSAGHLYGLRGRPERPSHDLLLLLEGGGGGRWGGLLLPGLGEEVHLWVVGGGWWVCGASCWKVGKLTPDVCIHIIRSYEHVVVYICIRAYTILLYTLLGYTKILPASSN